MEGKRLPADRQAEDCVLGSMLRRNETIDEVGTVLCEEDFYFDGSRKLFSTLCDLRRRGLPADPAIVCDELLSRKWLEDVGGATALAALWDGPYVASNATYYAGIVRDKATSRRLIAACLETLAEAESPTQPADEAVAQAQARFFGLSRHGGRASARSASEILRDVMADLAEQFDRRGQAWLTLGLPTLDGWTAGLKPGDLVYLAARPSVGKTGFAACISANVAREGKVVLFFSLEQRDRDLLQRLLSAESGVPLQRFRMGDVSADLLHERVLPARDRLADARLLVDDSPAQTLARIASVARRQKSFGGLDLLVIDYLQLIRSDNHKAARHEQVSEISRGLKALAREVGVPVLALAQLNRESESRMDGKPKLSDLRESGQLEADADLVMLLNRPREESRANLLEVIVAKHRNGPIGEFLLEFDRERMRMSEQNHY